METKSAYMLIQKKFISYRLCTAATYGGFAEKKKKKEYA